MKLDECYQIGWVVKPHGTKGVVTIFLDVDSPENYREMESVFVDINKKPVPFFIEWIRVNGKKALVQFEGLDSMERAEDIRSKKLYLPLSSLPKSQKDRPGYNDIIGYAMEDRVYGSIGLIEDVYKKKGQDLFVVDHKGHEVLVPVTDEWIVKIEHKKKKIIVDLPEGLIDVYLA